MSYDAPAECEGTSVSKRYDVVVVGAGVFGAWTAWHLARRGKHVLLVDAYGPANARASSSGESRIIRMGYGADEIYTRWARRSLAQWREFFERVGRRELLVETGVLWLARKDDARVRETAATLKGCGVRFEQMDRRTLEQWYPQFGLDEINWGLLEPDSGVLMARRAVAEWQKGAAANAQQAYQAAHAAHEAWRSTW